MKEAKPIFIIRTPRLFTTEEHNILTEIAAEKLKDYHVLIVTGTEEEDFMFECFNGDIPDIDIEQLKEKVNIKC